ncbi:MAG: hypothetical protein K6E55_09550, partial [Thermoguttaceae bacterium]|nr:hypothetical protein [Thermoguttaceae bacterium]
LELALDDIKTEQTGEHSKSSPDARAAAASSAARPSVPAKKTGKAQKENSSRPWYKEVPVLFWTLFAAGYILAIIMGCFFLVALFFGMR